MKLSSRLALVVSVILAIGTFATSFQAVVTMRSQKLSSYKSLLNSYAEQIKSSNEDELTLAIYLAEHSPTPMSLALITNNNESSAIVEDAEVDFGSYEKSQYQLGQFRPIQKGNALVRFVEIAKNEYLAFYLSTKELDAEINRSLRSILFFNFLLILLSVLLVTFLFRRDSKLNSAAKSMQEFIGDASHELKTPLTVIRGYSEILSKNPDQGEKYVRRIHDESLRMSGIIDQLLKIAALDEGRKEEPVSIDIAEYLKSHIEDILMLQPNRRVSYVAQPLMIKAPYDLVDTLLSNVLTNARIHSPEDAPLLISIAGKQVTIEDGGPGMDEIPDKPFKRFDSSRSRKTGGSGLGMSLIQKCAKELGAKLHFGKSELGGLKVEITF